MSNVKVYLSSDENIVLQSIASMDLIFALRDDDFLHSEYGQSILTQKISPHIRIVLEQGELINQGVIISGLYTLLVLPRELFNEQNFTAVDDYISSLVIEGKSSTTSTYKSDREKIKHIKHLRNAIAHGRLEFSYDSVPEANRVKNESLRLSDINDHDPSEEYSLTISLYHLSQVFNLLKEAFYEYLRGKSDSFIV